MAADEAYTPQDRMNLNGLVSSVSSVRITDRDACHSDLLVAGDGEVHWLYTTALENRISIPVDENATHVFFAVENGTFGPYRPHPGQDDSSTTLESGELSEDMIPLYGLQLLLGPTLAGLALTVLLAVLLFVHSEWYVVNTTGVLLGAGVSVMLGVTRTGLGHHVHGAGRRLRFLGRLQVKTHA